MNTAASRRALPVSSWPADDCSRWRAAISGSDPLEDPGRAAHWRPSTKHTVAMHYGLFLSFLEGSGCFDRNAPVAARVTQEAISAYLEDMRARGLAPVTIAGQIRDIREALRVMQVGVPPALEDLANRLQHAAEPSRRKRLAVVSPALILDAAIDEMARQHHAQKGHASRRVAERYRDVLIVAFLATRPVRLVNLTSIRIGHHLEKTGDSYWLRFRAAETKNGQALVFPLPATLTPWFDLYLAKHRPLLLREAQTDRLWISIRSTPMQENSIYYRVMDVTKRLLGRCINPHLFRDCVATFIAEQAPDQVRIIARILGHATLRTSEDHYNHAGMLSAHRKYTAALDMIRDGHAPSASV